MTGNVYTVDVRDVEYGDLIVGHPGRIVTSILLDCADGLSWLFADAAGRIIARRSIGSRVQVIRGGDDCPAGWILRPLSVVR
jgi:hypothetical protein